MFHRIANISKSRSFFLFGARGVGKSSLVRSLFLPTEVLWIDLLEARQERRYGVDPDKLSETIRANPSIEWVVIDEVQKIPRILDVVHKEIEEHHVKFVLTGSSARKLKRGGANLLAGRASVFYLYPLTYVELGERFRLDEVLRWGSLPFLFSLDEESERSLFLESYVHTYFREEILAEQLVRNVDPFRRFLDVAGQVNGTIINYRNIATDIGVDEKTAKNYFEILEDTLLGFILPSYHRSLRKQQKSAPKFYLFDLGVARLLSVGANLPISSSGELGAAFEHFIISEAVRLNSYLRLRYKFSYLATKGGLEIDLVLERPGKKTALVEIKSSESVQDRHLLHLKAIQKDFPEFEMFCLCRETEARLQDGIWILPWQMGLERLGFSTTDL